MAQDVEAVDLTKRYGRDSAVLDRVNVLLEAGVVTGIRGGNGSGKSTLLRLLAGVSVPTSGHVRGRTRRVGIVPEKFLPPPHLSALKYLIHMGKIRGLRALDAVERAHALAERFEIYPGSTVAMRALSKGNVQKVVIAQAFVAENDLLLLDEPRSGLDRSANIVLNELIMEAQDQGSVIVLADPDHRIDSASKWFDLSDGRLLPEEPDTVVSTGPTAKVLLSATSSGCDLAKLTENGDAAVITSRPGTVAIIVPSVQVDDFLRQALASQWSVLSVQNSASEDGAC